MNTTPEYPRQANPADTRPAVRSRHAAIRAIPTVATDNRDAVNAKAGKTEERSDQALSKPSSDMGVATLESPAASIAHEINQPLNSDCSQWRCLPAMAGPPDA